MNYKRLCTSCFGLGRLPVAPGSFGSLPPVFIFILLHHFGASAASISIVLALMVLAGSFVCILFSPAVTKLTGKKDPAEIVIDEFAAQAAALLIAGAVPGELALVTAAAAFLLFRLFDILKPWPLKAIEKLPAGWGILLDDLGGGVYAGLLLLVGLKTGFLGHVNGMFHAGTMIFNVPSALLLGAVQGLTEFLPVSSSGHLVLLEKLLHFDPEQPQMLLFDLAVHTGTIISILIVFRKSITAFIKNLTAFRKYGTSASDIYKRSPSVRIMIMAIAATAVTSVLGMSLKHYFESARSSITVVAVMWLINGTLLLIADRKRRCRMGLRQFGLAAAVIIGLAQTIAIMPGISRSGATICAAILIGLHRRWAVEFSFLIAIPAILGATAVELAQNIGIISTASLPPVSVAAGIAAAVLTGILALKILIKTSRKAKLTVFAVYCYILGTIVLIYCLR